MARGALCALGLVLALHCGPGRAGEYCHGWAGGPQRWHRGFQCPERYDGPEATLCCGTCSLRYCCSSREARLDQGRCPSDHQQRGGLANVTLPFSVPVYLPFLLVGSVFVAFVVGGACVGICCCKCLKSQDEGQQSGLAPGQTWLLEPDLPSRLSSSSSATRSLVSSGPQTSNICMTLAPSLPIMGLGEDARFLNPPPASGQLLHPSGSNHRIPTDRTAIMAPAPFLKRTTYGHRAHAAPLGVTRGDHTMCSGVHV
ncbi:protein shisa-1-like [Tyto alba]|uniref:protein shisa-1-like n=1 Tax=Tyto alba TaxID=56313 RepID=UPI0014023BD8|nr:protein shisa-1-like [Tyto alba]